MTRSAIPWPPPEPSLLDAPPPIRGYEPLRRVDEGDGTRTFLAAHQKTGVRAALVLRRTLGSWTVAPGRYTRPDHPRIARVLHDGSVDDVAYLIREWVPGTSFATLARRPPTRENTRRMCRAVLQVADLLEWMHTDGGTCEFLWRNGGTFEGPRILGNLNGRNVIVSEDGSVRLINCDRSQPIDAFDTIDPVTREPVDPRLTDVQACLALLDSIWATFTAEVVPIAAAVPRPVAEIRHRRYTTIHRFRNDLAAALADHPADQRSSDG